MLEWLIERIDHDVWNREYKEMFANPDGYARQQKSSQRIKPAGPDKRGYLNIQTVEKVAPDEVDLDSVLGKYGKPVARRDDGGLQIGPGDDGNLSVRGPEPAEG